MTDIFLFAHGLALFYHGDFQKASIEFAKTAGFDPASSRYLEKCKKLMAAPPKKWNGVWNLSAK